MITIAILGDSSSSGIGLTQDHYPYQIWRLLNEKQGVQIKNFAVPGLTSSDAAAFYHSRMEFSPLDGLIIYLGNNEGAGGPPKPFKNYHLWSLLLSFKVLGRNKSLKQFDNKRKNFFKYEESLEAAPVVSPVDFKKNIESIIVHAKKRGTKVILICPVANRYFTSGLGTANFAFIKNIDSQEKIAGLLRPADESSKVLIEGIRCQEEGLYADMLRHYEVLINTKDNLVSFLARHNRAVFWATRDPENSEQQMLSLLGMYRQYDTVIYYNLYLLNQRKVDLTKAERYLHLAYEYDRSLYRIKDDYRDGILSLSEKHGLDCLDLKQVLDGRDFIDYCHPTTEGHTKISLSLVKLLETGFEAPIATSNPSPNRYENIFISPRSYVTPQEDLVDYYTIDHPLGPETIRHELAKLFDELPFEDFTSSVVDFDDVMEKNKGNVLKCYLIRFMLINTEHPIFNRKLDLLGGHLPYSHEILSFPEFYLYRLLYNYNLFYERQYAGVGRDLFLDSSSYQRMVLRHNDHSLEMPVSMDLEYLSLIEEGIKRRLVASPIFENTIHIRKKTIIYWYTRESFRFGTLSRTSMLYHRWDIDILIESAVVGIVISHFIQDSARRKRLEGLLFSLKELVSIHEFHVGQYIKGEGFNPDSYNNCLLKKKANFLEMANECQEAA